MSNTSQRILRSACAPLALIVAACQPEPTPTVTPTTTTTTTTTAPAAHLDDGRGGRLFDSWSAELDIAFTPGKSGGPAGDGTLRDASKQTFANTGHDYRLKNFFGWDLRGAAGIYGPEYMNKPYVLSVNLLEDPRTKAELAAWLTSGGEGLPAFGEVMSPEQIEDVAMFIDGVRSGALPRPEKIFELVKDSPKNYALVAGADTQRGAKLYADACAHCHGADGSTIVIDDKFTAGAFMRQNGYEAWFKILSGQPGTPMHRELDFASGDDGAQQVLDVLAAMCDRGTFPPVAKDSDVPDGDRRCGAYLR
jgi:mono/diheme cytochrome c family protein